MGTYAGVGTCQERYGGYNGIRVCAYGCCEDIIVNISTPSYNYKPTVTVSFVFCCFFTQSLPTKCIIYYKCVVHDVVIIITYYYYGL